MDAREKLEEWFETGNVELQTKLPYVLKFQERWIKVPYDQKFNHTYKLGKDHTHWLGRNCLGKFQTEFTITDYSGFEGWFIFYFEKPEDAMLFKLTWI